MTEERAPREGRKRGGWTPVYREVWTHYLPLIGKDALIYYLYLLDHRQNNEDNTNYLRAWPGRNKVAEELGIAKKTLQTIDMLLDAVGLVEIERIPTPNGKPRIQYIVHDPLPANEIDVGFLRNQIVSLETRDGFDGNMNKTYITRLKKQDLKNNGSQQDIPTKPVSEYNSRDIIHYWCAKYEEVYGVKYVPKYGVEGALIKNKLLSTFGAERLIKIIDVVFAFYDDKWATPDFPRPTIGQLASWLANRAAAFVQDDEGGAEVQILDYEEMKRRGLL